MTATHWGRGVREREEGRVNYVIHGCNSPYTFFGFFWGGGEGEGGRRKGRGQGVWIVLFCVALFVVVICSVYVIATHSSGHTCQGVIWGRREGGEGVRIVLFCVAQRHFDASGLVEGCDSGCCSVYCSVLQSVAV